MNASDARDAHAIVCRLARDELGIEEDHTRGSAMYMWEGEGSPDPDDLSLFPPAMPGVASRITHDRHLGVFIGDARPESAQAVKDIYKLMDKAHAYHWQGLHHASTPYPAAIPA